MYSYHYCATSHSVQYTYCVWTYYAYFIVSHWLSLRINKASIYLCIALSLSLSTTQSIYNIYSRPYTSTRILFFVFKKSIVLLVHFLRESYGIFLSIKRFILWVLASHRPVRSSSPSFVSSLYLYIKSILIHNK